MQQGRAAAQLQRRAASRWEQPQPRPSEIPTRRARRLLPYPESANVCSMSRIGVTFGALSPSPMTLSR
jgi:hypothetical protein